MWTSVEEPSPASRDLVCTVCPLGCRITARQEASAVQLKGNTCARGEEYARQEMTDPRRVVTTTVKITHGIIRRLPVRTSAPFPLHLAPDLMRFIDTIELSAPIARGEVIARNLLEQGIDLLATRTVPVNAWVKG